MNKEQKDITLIHGDAMELLATLEPGSIDCVCTDPPYTSGGEAMKRGKPGGGQQYTQRSKKEDFIPFEDGTRDQLSHYWWSLEWMRKAHRALRPSGWLLCFTDWRQLPLTCITVQAAGFRWEGVNVWHKPSGRPNLCGFARQDEFIVVAVKGKPSSGQKKENYGCKTYAQLWEGMANAQDRQYHITPKPVGLLRHLLQVCRPGELVLDPFAGGGSTLVAARELGLRAIGFECSEDYYRIARDRLSDAAL